MLERRLNPTLRPRFETLKSDLLRRLNRVSPHLPTAERDRLAREMTRLRVRHEYRELLRV